jgi:hypothetical protein
LWDIGRPAQHRRKTTLGRRFRTGWVPLSRFGQRLGPVAPGSLIARCIKDRTVKSAAQVLRTQPSIRWVKLRRLAVTNIVHIFAGRMRRRNQGLWAA